MDPVWLGVQPCDFSDQLPHLVREVNDAVKFEIVGVTSNDEMNVIIVLCTDDIESMADVVKEESFLLGVWFGIETAQCDSFDFYVVCDIFWGYESPNCLYPPRNIYQSLR